VFGPGFEPTQRVIAGDNQLIYVLPRDSWNNNITSCPDLVFTAEFSSVENATTEFISGNCSLTFPIFPITYNLTRAVSWNINVVGEESPIENGRSGVVVWPANISAPHSTVFQPEGYSNLTAGSEVLIQLLLNDRFNNSITSDIECDYSNTALWNIFAVFANNSSVIYYALPVSCDQGSNALSQESGLFTTTYAVRQFGHFFVNATYGNESLQNSNYEVDFLAGTIDATQSWAIGAGVNGSSNVAGVPTSFKIYASNEFGIAITDGSLCINWDSTNFTVQFDSSYSWNDPSQTSTTVTSCNGVDGSFYGNYPPTRARTYNVTITLNKIPILGNPYRPTVVPAVVYPPNTIIIGLNKTINSDNGTFYLQARDQYLNNETNVDKASINITLSPTCVQTYVNTYNAGGGLLRVDWAVTEGGIYCVNIAFTSIEAQPRFHGQLDTIYYPILDASIHALGGVGCNSSCSSKGYCFRNMEPSTSATNYSCSCFQGWTGEDCSVKMSSKYPLAVGAVVGLVIGLGILMFIIGLILGFFLVRFLKTRGDDHHTLLD